MNQAEMQVFLDVSLHVFEKMTGAKPILHPPVVLLGKTKLYDYSGLIRISGAASGAVCLSMPKEMIDQLLHAQNETERTPALAQDLVGEAASIIASNTRKHFGEHFRVSLPETVNPDQIALLSLPYVRFSLPITWQNYQAVLLLAFSEQGLPALIPDGGV